MSDPNVRRRAAVIRQLIDRGARPKLAMSGTSMRPALDASMTLELGPAQAARPGDVLLFEGPRSLVAHRVIARDGEGWITAGDAVRHVEHVAPAASVARVERAFDARGRVLDGPLRRAFGRAMAAQRAARYQIRRRFQLRGERRAAWPHFLAVLAAAVRGDRTEFLRGLAAVDQHALFEVARRHRCAGIIADARRRWAPGPTKDVFARARLQTALRANAYERDVADVVAALRSTGCRFALLKGAARTYARDAGADRHVSFDIDVLLEHHDVVAATAALARYGYAGNGATQYDEHHHVAPLVAPGRPPVELHIALAGQWRFSLPLDAATMLERTRLVEGTAGPVAVLDDGARILHLCVHATGHRPLRDLALAAEYWRALGPAARAELTNEIAAERGERLRLGAAFARMRALAGDVVEMTPAVRRYERWVALRERLPDAWRERCDVLDAWYGAAPPRAAFEGIGIVRAIGRVGFALLAAPWSLADQAQLRERFEDRADVCTQIA